MHRSALAAFGFSLADLPDVIEQTLGDPPRRSMSGRRSHLGGIRPHRGRG
jgi:hypothetical protein